MDARHARHPPDQHRPGQRRAARSFPTARPCWSMPATAATCRRAGRRRGLTPRGRPASGSPATRGPWALRAIDYGYLTHFHDDHMNAMVDVAERFPIRTMLDRGWPDYDYPSADHRGVPVDPPSSRYRELLDAGRREGERLAPGRNDQIVLTRDPAKYPAVRGAQHRRQRRGLDGRRQRETRGTSRRSRRSPRRTGPPRTCAAWPSGSLRRLRLLHRRRHARHGRGPDIPAWHDVETPVAQAVGPVDVGRAEPPRQPRLDQRLPGRALRPRVWIIPVGPRTIPATTCSTACIRRGSIPARAMSSPPT